MIDYNTLNQVNQSLFGTIQANNMIDYSTQTSINQINQGWQYQNLGFANVANGLAQASKTLNDIYNFNAAIAAENTVRTINNLSAQNRAVDNKQVAQYAGSGIDVGSASLNSLRSESLAHYQNSIRQTKMDAENQRRANQYQLQVQQANNYREQLANANNMQANNISNQNKIAAAQYSGYTEKYKIQSQLNSVLPTLLSNINLGD